MPISDLLPGRNHRDRRTASRPAAFAQPRRWPRRHWLATSLLASGLALVLTAGVLAITQPWRKCGRGMTAVGSPYECVGLDLDSGPLQANDQLDSLERKIAAFNAGVPEPYATVVLFENMTRDTANDTDNVQASKNDIEGAFTAVWRAKNDTAAGDQTVFNVRLLLANTGSGNIYWRDAVQAIQRYAAAEHIVAVTGIGVSTEETKSAVAALGSDPARRFATVGSLVTADDMDHTHGLPNFYRVSPTNSDEVHVAVNYIRHSLEPSSVLLVRDVYAADSYANTLWNSFTNQWWGTPSQLRTIDYSSDIGVLNGGASRDEVISNLFVNKVTEFCHESPKVIPKVIYFAGRGVDILAFLKVLSDQSCTLRDTTLVSGDDANNLLGTTRLEPLNVVKNIVYTGLATPDLPDQTDDKQVDALNTFRGVFTHDMGFNDKDLVDGNAMMNYDAALVAIKAARTSRQSLSNPTLVVRYLAGIHGGASITGVSGEIDLNPNTGNPINKPMPLLSIDHDGQQTPIGMQCPEDTRC